MMEGLRRLVIGLTFAGYTSCGGGGGGGPKPTPTPDPFPPPTAEPVPTPTPVPTPPPPASAEYLKACPKPLASGATIRMAVAPYPRPDGPHRDSTLYVDGDPDFCFMIHGVRVNACHLEGWPDQEACEMGLLGLSVGMPFSCPVWQYQDRTGIHACHDDRNPSRSTSCDHFGSTLVRDDPKTPTTGATLDTLAGFEGYPRECGLQRNVYGPRAGFFTSPHGTPNVPSEVRVCRPDGEGCSGWLPVVLGVGP